MFMVRGLQLLPSGYAALIRSSEAIFSYTWEIIIFHQTPGYIKLIGAFLILSAVIMSVKHNLDNQQIDEKENKIELIQIKNKQEFEEEIIQSKELEVDLDTESLNLSEQTFEES